jgi:hypothetical protein
MSSGVFKSVPPPHLDRPQLRKANPEKDSRRRKTAIWLRQWFADNAVTTRMVHAMGVGAKGVIDEILAGRRSFHLDDISCIPTRHRAQFAVEYVAFLAQLDTESTPKTFAQLRLHG